MKILLVEDNRELSDWIAKTLRHSNFAVDCMYCGEDADHVLQIETYNLVILDLGLPRVSGLELLKRLRNRGSQVPVLILTADDTLGSRVSGLDHGADDYLSKPFEISELEARIRALLRRVNHKAAPVLQCGQLCFDSASRVFTLGDALFALTGREHAVLEALIMRAGKTIPKATLVQNVFELDEEVGPNAIEIYVHRVRKKLAGSGIGIVTIRGLGYMLKVGNGI